MKPSTLPAAAALPDPLPARQFRQFMLFWHVFLLGALAITLGISLRHTPNPLEWAGREWGLIGLVALQSALYLRTFAFYQRWPFGSWWWPVYILSNLLIWLVEWRIAPAFEWVILPFAGQLLGALPPKVSLPVNGGLFLIYLAARSHWYTLSGLSTWQVLTLLAPVAGFASLGLFVHKLSVTSSERARLNVELAAAKQQLECARQHDAELAALRERERLARDLHDSLGHALVTLAVQLEAVQRLYAVDALRASALLDDMKALTRSSMEDLRRSLANLRAPGLGPRSLAEALDTLLTQVRERTTLRVETEIGPGLDGLQPAVAEVLWRTAQEALTNVERHAQAQRVDLQLRVSSPWAVLRVTDDGAGLPAKAERLPGHYGLRGLRERVEGLGGTLTCARAGNAGTVIEARLPVC